MGKFVKGDVVVIPFPFSDLSMSKRRPALVLAESGSDDIILCQITGQQVKDERAIIMGNDDMENGSLRLVSNIRPNKLFTADAGIVLYKAGSLTQSKLDCVIDSVVEIFRDS
ncbi:MAG: type II toxin-antitoxin system PemK/MazF family toxin [Oscillospiraceae bacterium]|jgi:mRNA interferase MazF|nr:type II toxin-antitoxin system PemK/MazF family toxin [Oscillospiraceae bacterium]